MPAGRSFPKPPGSGVYRSARRHRTRSTFRSTLGRRRPSLSEIRRMHMVPEMRTVVNEIATRTFGGDDSDRMSRVSGRSDRPAHQFCVARAFPAISDRALKSPSTTRQQAAHWLTAAPRFYGRGHEAAERAAVSKTGLVRLRNIGNQRIDAADRARRSLAWLILIFVVGIFVHDEAAAMLAFKDQSAAKGRCSNITSAVRIMQISCAVEITFGVSNSNLDFLGKEVIKIWKCRADSGLQYSADGPFESPLMVRRQRSARV